jgi:hypothetical protein
VRQILAEWSRIGQTKIVNAERIPGGPITIQLTNVSEEQALDVLLRSVSGYVAAPRSGNAANLSQFDRIIVMPTSTAPKSPAVVTTQPATVAQSPFGAPGVPPPSANSDDEDDRPAGQPRPPVFNPFPQPQVVNPQAGPNTYPGFANSGAPNGIPTPGVPPQVPAVQPGAQVPAAGAYSGVPTTPYGGVAVPGMIAQPPPGTQQPGQVAVPGQPPQQPRRPEGNRN